MTLFVLNIIVYFHLFQNPLNVSCCVKKYNQLSKAALKGSTRFNWICSEIKIHYADSRNFIHKAMLNEILTNVQKELLGMCFLRHAEIYLLQKLILIKIC